MTKDKLITTLLQLGFEQMDDNILRKGNIDVQITEHDDELTNPTYEIKAIVNQTQVWATDDDGSPKYNEYDYELEKTEVQYYKVVDESDNDVVQDEIKTYKEAQDIIKSLTK